MRKMLLKRVGVVDEGLTNHGPRVKSSQLPASINTGLLEHSHTHSSSCTACRRCHIWDINHSWVTMYDLLTNSITLWPFAESLLPLQWLLHCSLHLGFIVQNPQPCLELLFTQCQWYPLTSLYVWANSDKCKKKGPVRQGRRPLWFIKCQVEVDSMVYFTPFLWNG